MGTLSLADQMTPAEIARRQKLNDAQVIIEAMTETNQVLLDATIVEASDGTVHRTTQRTSLPSGTRRIYGQGITTHASTTRQIEDTICMLADFSDIDAKMADHSPNKQALLQSEDTAFLEGLGQTQADDLFYAARSDGPEYIDGIYARMPAAADNVNLLKLETSGSNLSSVIIVKWAPDKAALFYPRGDKGLGISREYRGKVDATVAITNGRPSILPVYRTWFEVNYGLSVRHPKAVKRIANIKPGTTTGENLMLKVMEAINKLPPGAGNIVIYANAAVKTMMDQYLFIKSNMAYRLQDPWGNEVTQFSKGRIRQMDALLETEALIS